MVEQLRPTGRIPTVNQPTRVRSTKRERRRQDRHKHQSEDTKHDRPHEREEELITDAAAPADKKETSTGQRINVVI